MNSKPVFLKLTREHNLPVGEGKSERVSIPKTIFDDWNLAKHTIRGIVDTDGSIFVSDKPGSPNYPSIEITTNSLRLAKQLKDILSEHNFRTANIWQYKSKMSSHTAFKVALNGYKNVSMWLKEIGFSNPTKRRKAEEVIAKFSQKKCQSKA